MSAILSRRELLRRVGLGAAGLALAACQPKVVEVEKVVKETVVVTEEKEVEKVVKETVVVEKEVQAPQPTRGPIDLVGWSVHGMDPDAAVWKPYRDAILAIMEDELPDVTFTYRDMGWDEVLRQNLVTGLLGGTAPDIIVNESFIQPYARMGAYLPLDEALEEAGIKDNLIPGAHVNAVADGKLYGISQFTGVFAFESNARVVEQAGLDPNEWPTTWSQLLERCAAITQAGKDQYYGYTLQGPVGFLVGGIMRYNVYGTMAGAPMCKNDCLDPYFDDPKLEKPLAFVRELNRYTPPGLTWNPDEGQVYSQLHAGVSAYQIGAPWHMTWAKQYGVEDVVHTGPLPLPDEGGINTSRTVGNCLVLAMSGTKYPSETIEFMEILTRDEVTDHVYVVTSGRSPSTYSGLKRTLPNVSPYHKIFFEILQGAEVGAMPQWPKAVDKVWAAVNEMMTKVLSTEDPIPQLQAEAQAAAEKAIAEAG